MSSNKDNSGLTLEYWIERWSEGDTGWHHDAINSYLLAHWSAMEIAPGSEVFVPLCGKSNDMRWLVEQGYSVTGVEISVQAVEEFFADHGLAPEIEESPGFKIYSSPGYKILCGDIYKLTPDHLSNIGSVYDRAALVALEPDQRRRYAELMGSVLPGTCTAMLLISMHYPQQEMSGPPHSVPGGEVGDLFGDRFSITKLETNNLLEDTDRYADRGLSYLYEEVYRLVRMD